MFPHYQNRNLAIIDGDDYDDPILRAVNAYYGTADGDAQSAVTIGGMGEDDAGVWFAAADRTSHADDEEDILLSITSDRLHHSLQRIKFERHGVPLGLCTTGIGLDSSSLYQWRPFVSVLHVSLWGSNPVEYKRATGRDDFGRVCGCIVDAVEQGWAVEVSVLASHAASGRSLGHSLGAREVHVVEQQQEQ